MDRNRFLIGAPGQLVQIELPTRKDWAFIPDPLPPSWEFPSALWPLLAEAKEALGTLNGIGQTLPDPQLLLRPLQSREAITSSRIEGTYVTPEQLLLYELDPRETYSAGDRAADWREVSNYRHALLHGCELLKTLPICNRVIREVHRILLQGVRGLDKTPGEFRKWQVQIGSNGRFIPPPAGEVPRIMSDLEQYVNADDNRYDPLVRSYLVHYQFETIHPFADGNGRVGRALLALMLYKWLGHAMPWLYMSAFYEEYKDEYIANLFKVSAEGAWTTWIEFCLRGTIAQAKDSIYRCQRFQAVRNKFHSLVGSPSSRTHRMIDDLFKSPVLTIAAIARKFDVSYPTAKADVERLIQAGILKEINSTHPRSFHAPEIMQIAYQSQEELANLPDQH